MNIFDKAKSEIKEMLGLARFIDRFDFQMMAPGGPKPTETALKRRRNCEKRYVTLLKRYT